MTHVGVGLRAAAIGRIAFALLALAVGVLLYGAAGPTVAATFVVTKTADTNDGSCTVSLCSLRDAVIAANASPGSTITLPAGTYTLTIAGTGEDAAATGDLDINASVTINGAGAATTIVDGNALDRVFQVLSGTVAFNDLTIRNGLPAPGNNGGGVLVSGGTLTITRCTISGNSTTSGGSGGGIYTRNPVTITDSTISGNTSNVDGGGIYADGLVTMTGSTVSGNMAPNGDGGGAFVFFQLDIVNSTISGNSAVNGGGLFNDDTVTIRDSTITNNSATNSGGGINGSASFPITNTIVANNPTGGNCSGTIINGGTNLQFPGTTCGVAITSADPLLGPLANNGGPTQTHALLGGSAAIDAGTTGCPPTPATDQRGVARPQGPACDIGSFEVAVAGLPTLSINNVSANEGNSGTTPFTFTVTLSAPSASTVTVNFATADGTATAPSDYAATSGTLTFNPGVTTQTITVNVVGDTIVEPNETFFVNLSSPTNATIATGQGTGTIINDDVAGLPTLSINNVSANEGNSGLTPFVFTVTLSAASASTVTVNFATANGTATAGSDYVAASGTLTFTPGQTTQTITVNVNGDTNVEPNETFFVNLSAPSNATIATGQGTGTIVNDDVAAPPPPPTIIPTLSEWSLLLLAVLLAGLAMTRIRKGRTR